MADRRFVVVGLLVATTLLGTALASFIAIARARPSTLAFPVAHRIQLGPDDVSQSFFMPACTPHAIDVPLARATTSETSVQVELFVASGRGWPDEPVFSASQQIVAGSTHLIVELPSLADSWRRLFAFRLQLADGSPITIETRRIPGRWRGQIRVGSSWRGGESLPFDVISDARGVLSCVFDDNNRRMAWAATGAVFLLAIMVAAIAAFGVSGPHVVSGPAAARHEWWLLAPAGLAAVSGWLWLSTVPPFEGPDEVAHAQYANYVAATGALPDRLPEPGSRWMNGYYEWVQPPVAYIPAAAWLRWVGADAFDVPRANPLSQVSGGPERMLFRHGEPDRTQAARALKHLRSLNLASAVASILLMTFWLRRHLDDARVAVTGAAALALVPQWGAILSMTSNDAAATMLATVALMLLTHLATGASGVAVMLAAGAAIGLAVGSKLTAAFLIPAGLMACATTARRGRRIEAGAMVAGAVAACGWIYARQWIVFGDPWATAFKREILSRSGFAALSAAQPSVTERAFWNNLHAQVYQAFWARFGSLGAGPDDGSRIWIVFGGLTLLLVLLLVTGLVTLARTTRQGGDSERSRMNGFAPVVLIAFVAGIALWLGANLVNRSDTIVHWTPRHLLPLSGTALMIAAAGARSIGARGGWTALMTRLVGAALLAGLGVGWLVSWRHVVQQFHFGYL